MSEDYTEYLAVNVLNEQQLVCSRIIQSILRKLTPLRGELPLAEQGIEGSRQPGQTVRNLRNPHT